MTKQVGCVLLVLAIAGSGALSRADEAADAGAKPQAVPAGEADDLKAVRAAVETYVAAFNAADAKGVANCWSQRGSYITPGGVRLQGTGAIERHFADYFAENSGLKLVVTVDALRLVAPDVTLEEGTAYVSREDEPPSESTYVAVHVKRDGAWRLDTVRETVLPDEVETAGPLDGLAWLIGQWTDDSLEGVQVDSSYSWARDGKFLVNTFRVNIDGQIDLEGTQIIGWDPSRQTIRSWMFDSDGGFGEGTWTPGESDGQWTVEMKSVTPEGRHASAENHYRRVDDDKFTWASTKRSVGEAELSDVEPIEVHRVAEP
ncbi:MAG: SgcJ/EcaC family oxidoreductase [Pirellulales bacterium]|nr:SgcJ/EcaC family oxidoreductase [Pirellulales bacterium]